jgi:YspA, cpYpsA-related SLOG family
MIPIDAQSKRGALHVVAVTGGRNYRDNGELFAELNSIHAHRKIDLIVTGGCTGADLTAKLWAVEIWFNTQNFQSLLNNGGIAYEAVQLETR